MRLLRSSCHSWQTMRALRRPTKSYRVALRPAARCISLHAGTTMNGQVPSQQHHKQYHWIEGVEPLEKYKSGGYHPVMIGDTLNNCYQIVEKLGYGGYSTVWLARDVQQKVYVALKVGISESRLHETAILRNLSDIKHRTPSSLVALSGHDAIPSVLDEFVVRGPNGTHPCYTTAPAQSDLGDACFHYMFNLEVVRAICVKLVLAIAYMHSKGYAHGDIHLGNAMLKHASDMNSLSIEQVRERYGPPETVPISRTDGGPLSPNIHEKAVLPLYLGRKASEITLADTNLVLTDFGEAFAPAIDVRPREDCRSPLAARPPEARFEPSAQLSFSADIWTLGIALWNLVAMKPIFSDEFVTPDEVVAQQVDVLGPMPTRWWQQWEQRHEFLDEDGKSTQGKNASPPLGEAFDAWAQKYRRMHNAGVFSQEERMAFLWLLQKMLSFEPEKRPTAGEVLESDWIVKWALPNFEQSMTAVKQTEGEP